MARSSGDRLEASKGTMHQATRLSLLNICKFSDWRDSFCTSSGIGSDDSCVTWLVWDVALTWAIVMSIVIASINFAISITFHTFHMKHQVVIVDWVCIL